MSKCAACGKLADELVDASDETQYPNALVCVPCEMDSVEAAFRAMGIPMIFSDQVSL
jgi:hypothetical protein